MRPTRGRQSTGNTRRETDDPLPHRMHIHEGGGQGHHAAELGTPTFSQPQDNRLRPVWRCLTGHLMHEEGPNRIRRIHGCLEVHMGALASWRRLVLAATCVVLVGATSGHAASDEVIKYCIGMAGASFRDRVRVVKKDQQREFVIYEACRLQIQTEQEARDAGIDIAYLYQSLVEKEALNVGARDKFAASKHWMDANCTKWLADKGRVIESTVESDVLQPDPAHKIPEELRKSLVACLRDGVAYGVSCDLDPTPGGFKFKVHWKPTPAGAKLKEEARAQKKPLPFDSFLSNGKVDDASVASGKLFPKDTQLEVNGDIETFGPSQTARLP